MALLDIFNNNAFSLATLTDTVNRMPYVPQKVHDLGIFDSRGVMTTTVDVEERQGTLALIPDTPRGGVGSESAYNKHKLRNFRTAHWELSSTIMATAIQNVRVFGSEGILAGVQNIVNDRLPDMLAKHDASLEYQRVGALKGLILDADGSTPIYNLFTEFGLTQTVVDYTLGTAGTDIIGLNTQSVAGAIEDALGALTYGGIQVLAGKTWYERYITHPKVVTAYQYFWQNGQSMNPLRDDLRYKGFVFGNMAVDQYRGKVGGIPFIADNEAYAFPIGQGLDIYKTYFAPPDFIDGVNSVGLPRYAYQDPLPHDPRKGIRLRTQSNPISLCLRPDVLIKLVTSN